MWKASQSCIQIMRMQWLAKMSGRSEQANKKWCCIWILGNTVGNVNADMPEQGVTHFFSLLHSFEWGFSIAMFVYYADTNVAHTHTRARSHKLKMSFDAFIIAFTIYYAMNSSVLTQFNVCFYRNEVVYFGKSQIHCNRSHFVINKLWMKRHLYGIN